MHYEALVNLNFVISGLLFLLFLEMSQDQIKITQLSLGGGSTPL